MELRMKRNFISTRDNNGIGLISMLHRTNYVALVGGGKQPRFPINKLCIWDDLKKKPSIFLEFLSPVLGVILSRIRIIVILQNKVLIHAFESKPKLLHSYETFDNEDGVADLSTNEQVSILVFPGRAIGQIQLVDISPMNKDKNLISIIKAHKSKIRALSISNSGTMVASASETGTLIRIHDTLKCTLLFEFRRGLDKAVITSMKFSPNDSKLAVLSDKNTLHVYNLHSNSGSTGGNNAVGVSQNNDDGNGSISATGAGGSNWSLNKSHFLKNLPLLPNYFKSTWSFVSKNVGSNDDLVNDFGVLGWSDNDSIIILWKFKGIWEKYVIVERYQELSSSNSSLNSNKAKWEVVREGWRSFGNLDD
ncbi:unnamed protein product [Ambrosiozyma monospora]|uniref:Unnamed protein product n=1 Tax=Ambrosiozyma monospora TaxID=43982 RepID=A0A9W6YPU2_AMBMO|nr:unnamed protein product [Ambrosiozyma monospora]